MPELDRGTWTLAYDVAGAADAPAALLLHDIPDDRRVWRALATDMVEVFRTIAPDLRGFGESGQPPDPASPPAMRDYAADLAALLDAEGVAACAVIGAGFGAEVALELALGAPDRVDLIVLNGALPVADHPTYDDALRACEAERAEHGRLAGRFGTGRVGAGAAMPLTGAYLRASARERYRHTDADAFAAAHAARGDRDDLLTRLAALPVPALVVAGAEDPLLPAARLLAETLPNGRLEALEGCGRGAPFVAPQAFEGALGAFLGDVRAAGAHP
ncbi:MAG: alpha/beta fold hydrolase [Chloroflexota bacterium]|nr:alpha/beta fold hydrolase [Chloroflexota bacterium]